MVNICYSFKHHSSWQCFNTLYIHRQAISFKVPRVYSKYKALFAHLYEIDFSSNFMLSGEWYLCLFDFWDRRQVLHLLGQKHEFHISRRETWPKGVIYYARGCIAVFCKVQSNFETIIIAEYVGLSLVRFFLKRSFFFRFWQHLLLMYYPLWKEGAFSLMRLKVFSE